MKISGVISRVAKIWLHSRLKNYTPDEQQPSNPSANNIDSRVNVIRGKYHVTSCNRHLRALGRGLIVATMIALSTLSSHVSTATAQVFQNSIDIANQVTEMHYEAPLTQQILEARDVNKVTKVHLEEKRVRELYEIVVDKNTQRLYIVDRSSHEIVKSFIVSTGKKGFSTPSRNWTVTEITPNPWWYPPKSGWVRVKKPVPPGPNNPLGVLKIRLSGSSILIHGIPKWEYKYLGRPASHGCIRMRNEDIVQLREYIEIGSRVRTVDALKLSDNKIEAYRQGKVWYDYEPLEVND